MALNREMNLDHMGGANLITGVLKFGRDGRRRRQSDTVLELDSLLLALKVEEGIQTKGWGWPLESGKK